MKRKNIKVIIGIILGIIIGISTTVTAVTVFNSKDISYSSSLTTKKNVKDSLDELYTKASQVGECPTGKSCLNFNNIVRVGDYIRMTPISTSYTISKELTGYDSDQTINPSKLNLWRVIKKNDDGTVDTVSEYISSEKVSLKGITGYLNVVGTLNTISSQYSDQKSISKARHFGFSNQIEYCSEKVNCYEDDGYSVDSALVGYLSKTTLTGEGGIYWVASRGHKTYCKSRIVNISGEIDLTSDLCFQGVEKTYSASVLPILTFKADAQIKNGQGTKDSPYILY